MPPASLSVILAAQWRSCSTARHIAFQALSCRHHVLLELGSVRAWIVSDRSGCSSLCVLLPAPSLKEGRESERSAEVHADGRGVSGVGVLAVYQWPPMWPPSFQIRCSGSFIIRSNDAFPTQHCVHVIFGQLGPQQQKAGEGVEYHTGDFEGCCAKA